MSKVTLEQLGLGADDLSAIGKLSEKGLSPDEIADAIYIAHELVGQDLVTQTELTTAIEGIDALTPEQTATLDKLDGLGSSASEIDSNTKKTFIKEVKEFQRNPIESRFITNYNAYANAHKYNGEVFNAVQVFIKVAKSTTLRVMIHSQNLEPGFAPSWWTRVPLAMGQILVTTNDRYVNIPLDKLCNSALITDEYFYISISTEEQTAGVELASHNCVITDINDANLPDLYADVVLQKETDGGYKFIASTFQNTFCKFWFKLLHIDYDGLRTEKIEQDLNSNTEDSRIVKYPTFYNCEGLESHIYFKNFQKSLVDTFSYKYYCYPYDFTVLGANQVGTQQDERFIKSNSALVLGSKKAVANINFFEKYYQEVHDTAFFNHILVEKNNGNGQNCKLCCIGESTTSQAVYTQRLLDIALTDTLSLSLLGTRGATGSLNQFEAVGGKTMYWFTNDAASNFTNSSGVLDYSGFVALVGSTPDILSIQLGINAMLLVKSKYDLDFYINREMVAYVDFITHVKLTHPSTKFIINTCILPNELQSAFGKDFGTYLSRDMYRENIQAYNEALILLFKDREAEGIYLNCTQTLALDCVNGFDSEDIVLSVHTTKTSKRGSAGSGVHPNTYGYKLMGDALWACIKYIYKP